MRLLMISASLPPVWARICSSFRVACFISSSLASIASGNRLPACVSKNLSLVTSKSYVRSTDGPL
ncbi:hypothetical protein PF005_g12330 [Phytophthora fragariae]|uniref:RxLR effector protein n=1 Tax=Phytophthora fragariae TaxID=53985 RepID=A0A6A3IJS1_9STRA|nr:hypothetical protein PF003_g19819 [Phytophthora fragariae]KAE8925322.1 hypothetical protein PF009_g24469 [Phytophthora fragariae]KAE8980344.1 hypothetical protein PF011_g22475 [Phytophthora fragariae]KAE9077957.1 hypothetical protein PF010_g23309 [Phytophthora fragariae]KAE9078443.1 hypothetical protein PF007_g23859 [Phytophthora fragariae]